MGAVEKISNADGVERIPAKPRTQAVSDELRRIKESLVAACPPEAIVTFQFDDALSVHIDVRSLEHVRSEEHTSELQSLMRISYALLCSKTKKTHKDN